MKYFLIIVMMISYYLKELFVTEKNNDNSTRKTFTTMGWIVFTIMAVSLLYQTCSEERDNQIKENEAKQKNESDSIRYTKTIKNLENLIVGNQTILNKEEQLQKTQKELINFLSSEVNRLNKKIDRQSFLEKKSQFPIPDYFYVSFEITFDIEENRLEEYEQLIINTHKESIEKMLRDYTVGTESAIDISKKLLPNNQIGKSINYLNRNPSISIQFKNNDNELIMWLHEQISMPYRIENPNLSLSFKNIYYSLAYNPKKREIIFTANRLKMITNLDSNNYSLLDIENTKLQFLYRNLRVFPKFDLKYLRVTSPKNRNIYLTEFEKNDIYFERFLTKDIMWN